MGNVADGDLVGVVEREPHGHIWHSLNGEAVENTNRLGVNVGGRNLGDRKFHVEGLGFRSLYCSDKKRRSNNTARRLKVFQKGGQFATKKDETRHTICFV